MVTTVQAGVVLIRRVNSAAFRLNGTNGSATCVQHAAEWIGGDSWPTHGRQPVSAWLPSCRCLVAASLPQLRRSATGVHVVMLCRLHCGIGAAPRCGGNWQMQRQRAPRDPHPGNSSPPRLFGVCYEFMRSPTAGHEPGGRDTRGICCSCMQVRAASDQ